MGTANAPITERNALNPVKEVTALSGLDLAQIYGVPPDADAVVLPFNHHKKNEKTPLTCDAIIDPCDSAHAVHITREVLDFMKTANKLNHEGKLPYGHLVLHKEAADLVAQKRELALRGQLAAVGLPLVSVQPVAQYAPTTPAAPMVVGSVVPLTHPMGPTAPFVGTPTYETVPNAPKVDVSFSGTFGKLTVQYDQVFVSGINLVLVQRGAGASYEPPDTGEQPISIKTLGKEFKCLSGARLPWPDKSMTLLIFFIDEEAANG